jgi:hypothetical protein
MGDEQIATQAPPPNPNLQGNQNLSQSEVLKSIHGTQKNSSEEEHEKSQRILHLFKSFLFGIIFVVILVAIGGGLFIKYGKSLFSDTQTTSQQAQSLIQTKSGNLNSTSNWKTYENNTPRYSLKYPPYWFVYPLSEYPYQEYKGIDKNAIIFTSLNKFPNFSLGTGNGDQYIGINITKTNISLTGNYEAVQIGNSKAYKQTDKNGDVKWFIPDKRGKGGILISMKSLSVIDIKTINLLLSTFKLSQ